MVGRSVGRVVYGCTGVLVPDSFWARESRGFEAWFWMFLMVVFGEFWGFPLPLYLLSSIFDHRDRPKRGVLTPPSFQVAVMISDPCTVRPVGTAAAALQNGICSQTAFGILSGEDRVRYRLVGGRRTDDAEWELELVRDGDFVLLGLGQCTVLLGEGCRFLMDFSNVRTS